MTKESVEEKYAAIIAEKGADDCAAIIADLPGGTPYNAAMRIVAEHKNIQLVAGLCQQLLVLLNSGEDLANAIAQTGEIFGNAAVKKEKKAAAAPKEPVEKNGIVNFRLDERLIHGQVATFWTRTLQADRIIVADDDVLKDTIGVEALKAAVPSGVHLSILGVDNAAKRLNEGRYSGQRVFLIVNKVSTINRLLEKGQSVPALYLACGTEDYLLENNRDFRDFLHKKGIPAVYVESPGIHDWDFWNRALAPAVEWLMEDR